MKRFFIASLAFGILSVGTTLAQSQSRGDLLKQIESKHAELQLLEKQFLEPSQEDLDLYAEFLKQPDTGLTRLLPREIYDGTAHPEKRMTIHGGGSYFSFTRLTHEYGWGTQIGLDQNRLLTSFAGADYGMLANLGDVRIEDVNLETAAVGFLVSYEAATQESRARSEYQRFGAGVSTDNASYNTSQPVVVNSSYAMRGIHYSDSDVLVVFRVIRKDFDGSLVIAWKLLKKYPKPELARNKTESN